MPFTTQPLFGHPRTPFCAIIQPNGSRIELPPLSDLDAIEVAEWLNVIAEDNRGNEDLDEDV